MVENEKDDKKDNKERRGVLQTLFDPKTFPTLIPVLFAIGSAFIAIDRMVQRIDSTQQAIKEDVEENRLAILADSARTSDIAAQMSALQTLINAGTADRYRGSQASRDLALRDQRIDFMQDQLDQLKEEIRRVKEQERLRHSDGRGK